jgi:hypothetical protein
MALVPTSLAVLLCAALFADCNRTPAAPAPPAPGAAISCLALVRGIRLRAPSARIVAANLPNLAGLPYTSGYAPGAQQLMQRISVGFTTQAINPLVAQSVPVVDLMCDPRSYEARNYSSDGLHPNDAGYANGAAEFLKAINSSNYPAPQASCAQATLARR